jgi:hypothetical protein
MAGKQGICGREKGLFSCSDAIETGKSTNSEGERSEYANSFFGLSPQ